MYSSFVHVTFIQDDLLSSSLSLKYVIRFNKITDFSGFEL